MITMLERLLKAGLLVEFEALPKNQEKHKQVYVCRVCNRVDVFETQAKAVEDALGAAVGEAEERGWR